MSADILYCIAAPGRFTMHVSLSFLGVANAIHEWGLKAQIV